MNPKFEHIAFIVYALLIPVLAVAYFVMPIVLPFINFPSVFSEDHLFVLTLVGALVFGVLSLAALICTTIILLCKMRNNQKTLDDLAKEEFREYLLTVAKEKAKVKAAKENSGGNDNKPA